MREQVYPSKCIFLAFINGQVFLVRDKNGFLKIRSTYMYCNMFFSKERVMTHFTYFKYHQAFSTSIHTSVCRICKSLYNENTITIINNIVNYY